jgi:hypothetical protein
MYYVQTVPVPELTIAVSKTQTSLFWPVPSIDFVLQEAVDLTSGKWTPVAATRRLNYTSLLYEVNIPRQQSAAFYRLVSQ